jgi:hypothetical protein
MGIIFNIRMIARKISPEWTKCIVTVFEKKSMSLFLSIFEWNTRVRLRACVYTYYARRNATQRNATQRVLYSSPIATMCQVSCKTCGTSYVRINCVCCRFRKANSNGFADLVRRKFRNDHFLKTDPEKMKVIVSSSSKIKFVKDGLARLPPVRIDRRANISDNWEKNEIFFFFSINR